MSKQWPHFTVSGGNEAGVDLVLIQPFLLSYAHHVVLTLTKIFQALFPLEKDAGSYQNKVKDRKSSCRERV